MMNSYKLALRLTTLILCLVIAACVGNSRSPAGERSESRWQNPSVFDITDHVGGNLNSVTFDIEFAGPEDKVVRVKDCPDVAYIGGNQIASREFERWDLLKTDCEMASRFYLSPESAITHWPMAFDMSLLRTFPATAVPYVGRPTVEGRSVSLEKYESDLTFIESDTHSVRVSFDGMVVNYVELARADFNGDGYQDVFVRMDWRITEARGGGNDWVVLTKKSPNAAPMMLWRK